MLLNICSLLSREKDFNCGNLGKKYNKKCLNGEEGWSRRFSREKNWFIKVDEIQWPSQCGDLDMTDFSVRKEQYGLFKNSGNYNVLAHIL